LKNVYRDQGATTTITDADITAYTNANYDYVYTSVGSGDDIFTIYAAPNIETTTTAKATSKSDLSKYYGDFTDLSATEAYADYTGDIFFTYTGLDKSKLTTDRQLVVYGSKLSDAAKTEAVTVEQINTNIPDDVIAKETVLSYSSLSDAQKVAMAKALKEAGVSTITGNTDEVLLSQMTNYMNDGGYTYFRINTITGTTGIGFYTTAPENVADTTNVLYTGRAFTRRLTANETAFPARSAAELGAVYTNTTDYSAYVLKGTEKTVGDYNAQFLNDVYGLDASKFRANYQVSIASNGQISIYQTMEAQPEINANFGTQQAADGSVTYVTKTDTVEYKDVPNSGNISDLLATAEGAYKGLLSKVYKITDEDADAFGTDGTYSINADGSITLTTGTQTVQLKFNPATGALTTANGNANGLVDLVFDQSIPGNEAFGYQKASNDGDDVVAGRLTVDFSTVTNYNTQGASTIKAVKGDKKSLNTGRAVGEMNGVNVSTDGQIFATYSNGQTKLLGQIASAEFANASGLSKEGDNLYASTLNSGEATIQDITTDGGYMNTGVLEMSNVDLSREFTEMITTQRGFQANSRIITVSDTLLEELTNLKR
ncbi:MAG: flagellar hook-basal body complex protein, partial [Butyrivibrio sp.]|nr:flagellar hook-basal body complex protein [Butyrivibrio sp.]